ncbi:MAG: S8 family serine peptidase, partial [Gemmatimonadaceae bacterium]
MKAAAEAQRAAGIMMVVAAGNGGKNGVNDCSTVSDQPGTLEAVYSIGALNTGADTAASFTSKGPVTVDASNRLKPDLSAPGTNTRSAYNTSNTAYANLSGTSMATPHVAGAIALLWSAQPSLRDNVDETEAILNQAAVHLNPPAGSLCDPPGTTWPN